MSQHETKTRPLPEIIKSEQGRPSFERAENLIQTRVTMIEKHGNLDFITHTFDDRSTLIEINFNEWTVGTFHPEFNNEWEFLNILSIVDNTLFVASRSLK